VAAFYGGRSVRLSYAQIVNQKLSGMWQAGKDYRPLKKMGLSIRKSMDSLVEYWLLDQLSNQGRSMLEKNFALNITASLSGNPFSFDELIKEAKELFEREGVPGFIRVLLIFIDQFVITHWYQKLIPVGAWIRSSWAQIGREIKKANHPSKKLAFKPVANILLSDGDRNLIKGLKPLTLHQQRCQWHFVRDFKYAYKYQDKGDDAEAKKLTNELWDLIQRVEPKNMNLENMVMILNGQEKNAYSPFVFKSI
jgi:hypothetical protein